MDFNKFFKKLSWELKQSDNEDHDSEYEYLNFDEAMDVTNECIRELVEMNKRPFTTEEDFVFIEDTKKYRLPEMYNSVSHYFDHGEWFMISDSSDMLARIRSINDRELIFNPPIRKGQVIKLLVSKYPDEIRNGNDAVDFPEPYMRFLRLAIERKAMGRKGKEIAAVIAAEYEEWKIKWLLYNKPVEESSFMQFRGYGFGR